MRSPRNRALLVGSVFALGVLAVGWPALGAGRATGAQAGTPAVGAATEPGAATPIVVECLVASRDPVQIITSVGTPEPWPQIRDEGRLPDGAPADATVVAAVTAVERELLACLGAGEFPRAFALLTEESAARWVAAGSVGALALGLPENAVVALRAVRDARLLPDGRVGAVVEWDLPLGAGFEDQVLFHVYRQVDGRWLLDEEIAIVIPGTPTAGAGV